jgi:hypothetical protein
MNTKHSLSTRIPRGLGSVFAVARTLARRHPGWRYALLFAGVAFEAMPLGKLIDSVNHGGWAPTLDTSAVLFAVSGIVCMLLFRKAGTDDTRSTNRRSSRTRRIFGSCVCALAGWIGFLSVIYILLVCAALGRGKQLTAEDLWKGIPELFFWIGAPGIPVFFRCWLIMVLPLYLLVPPQSPLWRWKPAVAFGAVEGAVVGLATEIEPWTVLSLALVGAGMCLFASLTRRWLNPAVDSGSNLSIPEPPSASVPPHSTAASRASD